jgi:RNase P/RNase MRP subunit POP5
MRNKSKIKAVSPTLRGKKRYLLFRLSGDGGFPRSEVEKAIWDCFLGLYGSYGCSLMKLWLVSWNQRESSGIIRYALDEDLRARAGMLFLREVAGKPVSVRLLKASGAIGRLKG